MEVWFFVSVTELGDSSVVAVHHDVVEVWLVQSLVDRPEAKDFLEIVEVHPENTVIAASVETNLVSKFISPQWR